MRQDIFDRLDLPSREEYMLHAELGMQQLRQVNMQSEVHLLAFDLDMVVERTGKVCGLSDLENLIHEQYFLNQQYFALVKENYHFFL
ncbi:MAG TPA: hypothetical protein VEH81_02425 [Ktedonobacteraceae bacterium]|nr:hypothetical protein [Ktedonobacteraceae bacterium]